MRRSGRLGKKLIKGIGWLILSYIPLFVGIGFIYLMFPGGIGFASLTGTSSLVLVTTFFLLPFHANSYLPWLAWIISGFIGGLIFRGILVPFLFTIGYASIIVYLGGGSLGLNMLPPSWTARIIILNTLIVGISFLFGAWIGSSLRKR